MSEPFLAEVRLVGFNFAPRGWAFCDGQVLPINQNQSLYSLLGTTYGGDGRTSFALPDMRGRCAVHRGDNGGLDVALGQKGGQETHTLTSAEMPSHNHSEHAASTDASAGSDDPAGGVLANNGANNFSSGNPNASLGSVTIANAGGGQAHENMQPFLALNYCIALRGLFPSRN